MGVHIPEQPSFIEGIGDEIITLISLFISTLVYLNFLRSRWVNRPSRIHPEFVASVETTRRLLDGGQDRRVLQDGSDHGQRVCPICLGEAVYAVETNCGHHYCGPCFLAYWQHRDWFGAVPCPSCRTRVTLLLLHFTGVEATEARGVAVTVRQGVNNYNHGFSAESRTIMEHIWDLPTLLRHAWNDHHFTLRTLFLMHRLRFILVFAFVVLYLFTPFDVIPEAVFGIFGFVDDLLLLFLLIVGVSVIYRRFVVTRAQGVNNNAR